MDIGTIWNETPYLETERTDLRLIVKRFTHLKIKFLDLGTIWNETLFLETEGNAIEKRCLIE